VDELRVMASVAAPPEIGAGEVSMIEAVILDPLARGADVLVWTCVFTGDGCLESEGALSDWARVTDLTDPTFEFTASLAPGEGEVLPVSVWWLACEPGLCPIIEAVRAADGGRADASLAADLMDPFSWLDEVPLTGVSLARGGVAVSSRPEAERVQNPTLTPLFEADSVRAAPLEAIALTFAIDAEVTGYGYATAGGFESGPTASSEGALTTLWYAPEQVGSVEMVVVAQADDGGVAVWQGVAEVLSEER
jgi:hypothetical protein